MTIFGGNVELLLSIGGIRWISHANRCLSILTDETTSHVLQATA